MKEIDTVKDQKTASFKRLEDFRNEKTRLVTKEDQLKKQKVKEAADLDSKLKASKFEEVK
jgi:hypothetical protein